MLFVTNQGPTIDPHFLHISFIMKIDYLYRYLNLKDSNDQELVQSKFHYKTQVENNLYDNWVLILREHTVRRVISYFPEGGCSIT